MEVAATILEQDALYSVAVAEARKALEDSTFMTEVAKSVREALAGKTTLTAEERQALCESTIIKHSLSIPSKIQETLKTRLLAIVEKHHEDFTVKSH